MPKLTGAPTTPVYLILKRELIGRDYKITAVMPAPPTEDTLAEHAAIPSEAVVADKEIGAKVEGDRMIVVKVDALTLVWGD